MKKRKKKSPLHARLEKACLVHGVDYDVGRGKSIPIPMVPVPLALSAAYLGYAHELSEAINRHLRRMPAAWFADERLREVLPFPDPERRFIESVWKDSHGTRQTVVSRNDFDMPGDPRESVAFEANGCAIGGIWYGAACARVGREVLARDLHGRGVAMIQDGYDVFLEHLRAHAKREGVWGAGRPSRGRRREPEGRASLEGMRVRFRIGLLEDRSWDAGITEMPSLARRLTVDGWDVVLGDPRDLTVRAGAFRLDGQPVDLLYRNMEISDFATIESERGSKLTALREAFRENRVVSSVAGDFDQKALWEVLTSQRFERHVAKADRVLLREHLLWTRLLRDGETEDPSGRLVDLVSWALANRRSLVLKPNLLCGGEDVTLGPLLSPKQWERVVRRAAKQRGYWVLQKFHRASRFAFRGVGARYITCGVISSPHAISALGRASLDAVVNVSRGGGLVPLYRRTSRGPARTALRAD